MKEKVPIYYETPYYLLQQIKLYYFNLSLLCIYKYITCNNIKKD
jgi:hypothetical protein